MTQQRTQGTKKTGVVTPVFLSTRSIVAPLCSRAGSGFGNRIRGDARCPSAATGEGPDPRGPLPPKGRLAGANDKPLHRADTVRARAIQKRVAIGGARLGPLTVQYMLT